MTPVFCDVTGPPALSSGYCTDAWICKLEFCLLMEFPFPVEVGQKSIPAADESPELLAALGAKIPAVVLGIMNDVQLRRVEPSTDGFFRRISAEGKKCFNPFLAVVKTVRIHNVFLSRGVKHNLC